MSLLNYQPVIAVLRLWQIISFIGFTESVRQKIPTIIINVRKTIETHPRLRHRHVQGHMSLSVQTHTHTPKKKKKKKK